MTANENPPGDPAIEVEGLRKTYGQLVAVDDVSFAVAPGEVFGILGPNGAGKTTTVECIQGLISPDEGRVRLFGEDFTARRARRLIGSQLQDSALPDQMKVREALDLFASLGASEVNRDEALDRWGLASKAESRFADLSGGQQQRLFVALALLHDPAVVFLDEMTQGLDPAARRVTWQLIRDIRDAGSTVVLVTHHMDEAEALCDRLAVFADGRIVATGPPNELVASVCPDKRVMFSTDRDVSWLTDLEEVAAVSVRNGVATVVGRDAVLARVAAALVARELVPKDLRLLQPGLEEVYLALTRDTASGDCSK